MKYLLLTFWLIVAACSSYAADAVAPAKQNANEAKLPERLTGKVTETMRSTGYTYVQVDTGSKKVWAAAPEFDVKVGDSVAFSPEMPMPNYHSKSLNRDFDVVYFTDAIAVNGLASKTLPPATQELPKGHPPIGSGASSASTGGKLPALPEGHPPLGASSKTELNLSGIKKAPGGQTVADIYASSAKLSGKEVKVRGKVVKYNAGILGKNWVHVRDGTGAEGKNDLLVTTGTDVKVGDTVLVTGVLATNKDFGAGYRYPVIVEDAKIAME